MGKKQHQKDKLYLTTTEWSEQYGGKKRSSDLGANAKFRRLPFSCCSLSLQPFEYPICSDKGHVFECENIMKFLKQYGIDPITGDKLTYKNLTRLNFFKNNNGSYHCPVTFKVFNENTHIVAIKTSGNVFSFEAIDMLNIKTRNWRDLISDEEFTRKDIITIQDPANLDKFNFANFEHVRKNLRLVDDEDDLKYSDSKNILNHVNNEARQILEELNRTFKPLQKAEEVVKKADAVNAAHYSTGKVSASFTSTVLDPVTHFEADIIDEDILRYQRVKTKALVQIVTSLGNLNFMLHSDEVPKTCENFVRHCLSGYYEGTIFHRSIKHFMIQGGDPEGTGRGGQSIWGAPFKDEFKPNLTHSGRGILSMANSGKNTNKSQFFITYRSAKHLDNKHTVFGRVVGGMEVLAKIEEVKTNSKDKPVEDIMILKCNVFNNPYEEADKILAGERLTKSKSNDEKKPKVEVKKEILKKEERPIAISLKRNFSELEGVESETTIKKKNIRTTFNFDSW